MRWCASGPGCPSPTISSAGWTSMIANGRFCSTNSALTMEASAWPSSARSAPMDPLERVLETKVRLIGSVPAARYVHDLKAQVLSHLRRERLLVRHPVADRDRLAGNDERRQLRIGCAGVARGAVAPRVDRVRDAPLIRTEDSRPRGQQHPAESRIFTAESELEFERPPIGSPVLLQAEHHLGGGERN